MGDPFLHQRAGEAGEVDPVGLPSGTIDGEQGRVTDVDVIAVAIGRVERHDQFGTDIVDDPGDRGRHAIERRSHEGPFVDLAGDPGVLEVEHDDPTDAQEVGGGPQLTLTPEGEGGLPAVRAG